MEFRFVMVLLWGACLSFSPAVFAQGDEGAEDGWKSSLVLYLMGPNIDGTVGAGPIQGDIKLEPGDILDSFDSGFLGIFGMEKDRWGFVIDGVYMDLKEDASGPNGIVTGTVGTEQLILGALASYRLTENTRFLFGGLYVDLSNTFDLSGPIQDRRTKVSENWVDPLVGVNVTRPLNEKWTLGGMAAIGGFGVGSDFTWQVTGSISYSLTDRTSIIGGFRYMDFDYEDGSGQDFFKFDVAEYGAAFGFRFDF